MPDNETLDRRSLYSSMFSRSAIHCHSQKPAPSVDYGAFSSFFQKGGSFKHQDIVDQGKRIKIDDHCCVISCDEFVRTGRNPSQEFQYKERGEPEAIKLDNCDSFTHALRGVEELVNYEVENSPHLQALMKKDVWTRNDRLGWEREVSKIVSSELAKVPGLDHYRATTDYPGFQTAEKRPAYLNELSSDMENNTQKIRFCCEEMSFVEGYLLQKTDDHFLGTRFSRDDIASLLKKPEGAHSMREAKTFADIIASAKGNAPGDAPRNYKTPGSYFFAVGDINQSSADTKAGHHAFIISPIGNIVESTVTEVNGHPYIVIANTTGIKDYIAGKPFVQDRFDVGNSLVYGPSITAEGAQNARVEILVARAERSTSEFIQTVSALPGKAPAIAVVMDTVKSSAGKMSGDTLGMVVDLMDESRADLQPVSSGLENMTDGWEKAIALAGDNPALRELVKKRMETSMDKVLGNDQVRSLPADLLTLSTLNETISDWRDEQRLALAGGAPVVPGIAPPRVVAAQP